MDNSTGVNEIKKPEANVEIAGYLKQLSNDIKTPINRIVGDVELISHEEISPKLRDSLIDIRLAANSMSRLTEDLIDLVRISNNELDILDEEYCFESIVLEIRHFIERECGQKGIESQIDIDSEIPYCMFGDEHRIRTMLEKLITNAVRNTDSGTVVFSAKSIPAGQGKVFLRFDITDSGEGILNEDIVTVLGGKGAAFEKGIIGVDSAAIGVFLVKYFAAQMGGKLSVKASQGIGCTYTVLIGQESVGIGTMADHYDRVFSSEAKFTAPAARILVVGTTEERGKRGKKLLDKYQINIDMTDSVSAVERLVKRIGYDIIVVDGLTDDLGNVGNIPIVRLAEAERPDPETVESILLEHLPADKIIYVVSGDDAGNSLGVLEKLGLNIRSALANFAGDEDEYKDVLLTMCRSSDTKIKMLNYYLEQHDYKNYIVAMHGILGVAQVIGAESLANRSRELESAAKQGMREVLEAETAKFGETFEKLLESVRNTLNTVDKESQKGAIDKEDLVAIINELRGYLSDYQINEVEELFFALAQFSYHNTKIMELIHTAEEQMLSYNYNSVMATLDSILAELSAE